MDLASSSSSSSSSGWKDSPADDVRPLGSSSWSSEYPLSRFPTDEEIPPMVNPLDSGLRRPAQNSEPLRTLSTPSAVEMIECKLELVCAWDLPIGGGDQEEDWRYSRVGSERRAEPRAPPYNISSACGGACRASARRIARGEGGPGLAALGWGLESEGNVCAVRKITSAWGMRTSTPSRALRPRSTLRTQCARHFRSRARPSTPRMLESVVLILRPSKCSQSKGAGESGLRVGTIAVCGAALPAGAVAGLEAILDLGGGVETNAFGKTGAGEGGFGGG